jgi:hypothetical protein
MADVEQKVVEIIDKLQGLAQPAMDSALSAIRAGGIMYLVTGAVCGAICAFALRIVLAQVKRADDAPYDNEELHIFAVIVAGIVALGFGIATGFNLLDPSNWLAAIRPDLALARALLNRVL